MDMKDVVFIIHLEKSVYFRTHFIITKGYNKCSNVEYAVESFKITVMWPLNLEVFSEHVFFFFIVIIVATDSKDGSHHE